MLRDEQHDELRAVVTGLTAEVADNDDTVVRTQCVHSTVVARASHVWWPVCITTVRAGANVCTVGFENHLINYAVRDTPTEGGYRRQ